jgi:hypothetical protein
MQRRAGALDLQQLLIDALACGFDGLADRMQLLQRGTRTVLLQPQPLPQHFLHGVAHRVAIAAGNGLDLGPGGAQARLQPVRGVQQLAKRALPFTASSAAQQQEEGGGPGGDGQQSEGQGQEGAGWEVEAGSLPWAASTGKFPRHTRAWASLPV